MDAKVHIPPATVGAVRDKITIAEMESIFGKSMPVQAARLIQDFPPGGSIDDLRQKLRNIAAQIGRPAAEREAMRRLEKILFQADHALFAKDARLAVKPEDLRLALVAARRAAAIDATVAAEIAPTDQNAAVAVAYSAFIDAVNAGHGVGMAALGIAIAAYEAAMAIVEHEAEQGAEVAPAPPPPQAAGQ